MALIRTSRRHTTAARLKPLPSVSVRSEAAIPNSFQMTSCPGCGRAQRIIARGLCGACYKRIQKRDDFERLPRLSLQARFEQYVERDPNSGCWLWTGGVNAKGYGTFNGPGVGKKIGKAHRVAWEIYRGPIPQGNGYHGTCVLHRCDTPACVNPDHLFLGTVIENNADAMAKDRVPRGDGRYNAKINPDIVRTIRSNRANGHNFNRIAADLGLTWACVRKAALKITWAHVE